MKNPIQIILLVFDALLDKYCCNCIILPFKKEGQYLKIEINKFEQILQKKLQINMNFISLEFFDRFEKRFQEQYQYIENDCFKFIEDFFGDGEHKILEIKLQSMLKYYQVQELNEQQQQINMLEKDSQNLKEQLELRQSELEELKIEIEQIQFPNSEPIDIAIFYNSALIKLDNHIQEAQCIDYESEITIIEDQIKESDFRYKIFQATRDNFDLVKKLNPQVLHFIINGNNGPTGLGLVLEMQKNGMVDIFDVKDFTNNFISASSLKKNLKLICISSNLGCIEFQQKKKLAVIQKQNFDSENKHDNQFWKVFYQQLVREKSTIDISFKNAEEEAKNQKSQSNYFQNKNLDKKLEIRQHQNPQQFSGYLKINKQIIIIESEDNKESEANKQKLIEKIEKYFDNYCKLKNLKQLDKIEIEPTIGDFENFLNTKDNNNLVVLRFKNIDVLEQNKFKKFQEDLLGKLKLKLKKHENLIIIYDNLTNLDSLQLINKDDEENFIQRLNYDDIDTSLTNQDKN